MSIESKLAHALNIFGASLQSTEEETLQHMISEYFDSRELREEDPGSSDD